jgi:adenylate cyclase
VPPAPTERKLAAILSADVVGYSRLMAEDEAGTIRTLTSYRNEIRSLVGDHRGRVVDATGDNLLAEFPTALDAVECAAEVQRVIGARNTSLPAARRMEFRIGVHLGDVTVEEDRLYGDGVNIAARLEGLADPGGVCISSEVYGQVERKLDLGFEDLGEKEVKNIPNSIRVYRIRLVSEAAIHDLDLPGMDELTVPGFGGAPAIAVLPFDNLSADPEQEYFADGLAEDLITRLSRFRIPVIARNSSFTYKGEPVDVKRVSRELGVRYVVEGSVRRADERVRISAQLIDATTGQHVWAERYDRELGDTFGVQDEVTLVIVESIYPEYARSERERAVRRPPQDLDAWECVQRAAWHAFRVTKEDLATGRSFCERAIELDARSSTAFALLAGLHLSEAALQWTDDPARSIREGLRAAETSVELDGTEPTAHVALGMAHQLMGEPGKAVAAYELAVQLNPSLAIAYLRLGDLLPLLGRADEGIANIETALRLSARDPMIAVHLFQMGAALLVAGRYAEAIEWTQRSLQLNPQFEASYTILAASYARLGQMDEARMAVEKLLRRNPDYSLVGAGRALAGAVPEVQERFLDSLRKAGLPEV